ncbi:MAG: hypothetical protein ACK4KV_19185 [Rhodocyclaceae bacterium]
MATEQELKMIVQASIINLGRTLPVGAEITFYRDADDPRPRVHTLFSDGSMEEYAFTSHGPLYLVPTIDADGDAIVQLSAQPAGAGRG